MAAEQVYLLWTAELKDSEDFAGRVSDFVVQRKLVEVVDAASEDGAGLGFEEREGRSAEDLLRVEYVLHGRDVRDAGRLGHLDARVGQTAFSCRGQPQSQLSRAAEAPDEDAAKLV